MKTNAEILQERAVLLAVDASVNSSEVIDYLNVVEFLLTPERYGIESQLISEVLLLKELAPIPGAPTFVAGVTNIRGKIVSMINLKAFLGLVSKGITELNKTIIIQHNGIEFGIIADAITGTRSIDSKSLRAAPVTLKGKGAAFVKGIAPDGMILLDGIKLISETTIIVNQK